QSICNEVIDANKNGNADDLIVVEKNSVDDSKGKVSTSCLSDHDVAPIHSCEEFGPISHNLTVEDESSHDMNFSDDDGYFNDDEMAMMQAHFDSLDISPGVEAAIPWWPSYKGSETPSVSASTSAFISPSSYNNAGTSTGTSVTAFNGSNYSAQPFPMPYLEKQYSEPLHIQHKLPTWTSYSMLPSGAMAPSSSGAEAGTPLPSGWKPYPPYPMMTKTLQLPNISYGGNNHFTGWKIQGEDAGDLSDHNFTSNYMGEFPYFQDPSVVLDQGIAAEILAPFDLTSFNEKDRSEAEIVKKLESFKKFDTVQDHSDHHYFSKNQSRPSKDWVKKIQEEWRILEKDLPDAIFVRVYETRMDLLRAVIVGADGTPYHDGIFFFDFHFPPLYPNVPPHVHYRSGGLRLNPNLYDNGKVCLSLLNTWIGDGNEMWVPGVSTILQVLVSIQGLILNAEPYFNEPGYEGMAATPEGERYSRKYSETAFLLSMKTMLYSMRQPPKHFEDFVFGHFCKSAHDILIACKAYLDGAQVGTLVKGAIQDAQGDDKHSCSKIFKIHLPVYINSLVKAFTKIGVTDCEKHIVLVNNDTIADKPSSLHGLDSKAELKFDGVVGEKA
ncbi:hypothetical protein V2J09_008813, partial [Rumex salicifolius]